MACGAPVSQEAGWKVNDGVLDQHVLLNLVYGEIDECAHRARQLLAAEVNNVNAESNESRRCCMSLTAYEDRRIR